tara:strand:+ start:6238 stop:6936 length:699 start_codon:yes stop_codon:yes gene_type:complete
MKYILRKIFILMATFQFAFGLAGFGFYGNQDLFSVTPGSTSSDNVSVVPSSIDGATAFGVYLYVDALPFVDLQADFEFAYSPYNFISSALGQSSNGEFVWGRVSQYYSIRKEIIGISIPFLAKAQIYGGAGFNSHTVTPSVSVDFIENAFPDMPSLEDAASQDFSSDETMDILTDFIMDNRIETSGVHVMVGGQAKLLVFNVFANLRYTMAKDVLPGKNGFPSMWVGIGYGL